MAWYQLLKAFSISAVVLSAGFGLLHYQMFERYMRYLVLLLVVASVTEIIIYVLAIYKVNNLVFFHIYPPVEYLLLSLMYGEVFTGNQKKWIIGALIFFSLFSLTNSTLIESGDPFNAYGRTLENFLLVFLALGYFIGQLTKSDTGVPLNHPMVWINIGVLTYFSVNLIFFSMNNYLIRYFSLEQNRFFWGLHGMSSLIQYVCFFTAIFMVWKKGE